MSDIVARLRDKWRHSEEDCYEASDEIVRLRGEVERLTTLCNLLEAQTLNYAAERDAAIARAEAAERERDWHKSLTQSHDLIADNAAQKTRAEAAEAAMFDLLRENKRLAKSRDRWGQRYNKILLQLRAAVMTDTDYIKAVDEACENALVERDAAVARAEAAEAKVAKLRGALKPFAEALDGNYAEQEEDHVDLWESGAATVVTYGDLRRARTALQETEQ